MSVKDLLSGQTRREKSDYRLSPRPIAHGGQAAVFEAEHKETGSKVAFKRLTSRNPHAVARMRREIEFGQRLQDHDHIMPVLDHGQAYDWFVMPLAEANAEELFSPLKQREQLQDLLLSVCAALEAAHGIGWVHRDLKPANLLLLDRRWTVADWGLGRRPRGDTTFTGRTPRGEFLGTEGFAAPEQATDAHGALSAADIYSLGQIIGWARTGRQPRQGRPLLPDDDPWRSITAAATRRDPLQRPQSVAEFRGLIQEGLARTA